LYGAFGGRKDSNQYEMAMLWVLNMSDGEHSLLDIAERSGTAFPFISEAAATLLEHGLLRQT
jgi:aminopeptidase-like protein